MSGRDRAPGRSRKKRVVASTDRSTRSARSTPITAYWMGTASPAPGIRPWKAASTTRFDTTSTGTTSRRTEGSATHAFTTPRPA